jgi:plasmid stabilization system protein ParE
VQPGACLGTIPRIRDWIWFSPEASLDPDEIWEFIADDNPDAADRTTEEILSAIEALVAFPHQGFRRPNLTSRPLRFKLVNNYVIAYAP